MAAEAFENLHLVRMMAEKHLSGLILRAHQWNEVHTGVAFVGSNPYFYKIDAFSPILHGLRMYDSYPARQTRRLEADYE